MFFKRAILSGNGRMFRRLRSFCLVKYSLANSRDQRKILVNPKNISAGGALFISDTIIPKNSVLEMDIYLPPLKNFFTAMANVVGCSPTKDTQQYWVRVRFNAIDPQERREINFYIEQLAKNPFTYRYLDKGQGTFKRTLPLGLKLINSSEEG